MRDGRIERQWGDCTVRWGDSRRSHAITDGVALWFVRGLVETFDAGHKADPLIPRLKVVKLRSRLARGRHTKKAAAKTAKPQPPAPPTA
jgi:hypothetical protein